MLKNVIVAILTFEARMVYLRKRPFVVAVTGSVGKTSTKDAIFTVLSECKTKGQVIRKSQKSFNSEIGLPLTILGLSNAWNNPIHWMWNIVRGFLISLFPFGYPNILVLEIGADHPGDITNVVSWLKPNITVVTRIPDHPVHAEFFKGPEEVKNEKAELVRVLTDKGVFIANADDTTVLSLEKETQAPMFTYGFSETAMVRGDFPEIMYEETEHGKVPTGMSFLVAWKGESHPVILKGILGNQSVSSTLAAISVGLMRGIPITDVILSLQKLKFPPGRMKIIEGRGVTTIIDDSYNSSPAAIEAALQTLRDIEATHKIALLGDMLELGDFSKEEHWRIGRIAGSFVDTLVVVGNRARIIAEAAKTSGLPQEKIQIFSESQSAGEWVAKHIMPNDVILVKGSQGSGQNMIRMERGIPAFMAHPEQASQLLVRQDAEWMSQYR